jgi:hypothetical protein
MSERQRPFLWRLGVGFRWTRIGKSILRDQVGQTGATGNEIAAATLDKDVDAKAHGLLLGEE